MPYTAPQQGRPFSPTGTDTRKMGGRGPKHGESSRCSRGRPARSVSPCLKTNPSLQVPSEDEMSDEIRRIRSYVLAEQSGELGTVCIYQASISAAMRRHAARAGLLVDEIVPVADTMIVGSDPDRVHA